LSGWLLNTNVISEPSRRHPNSEVVAWLNTASERSAWVSVISIGEIRTGVDRLPQGARRALYEAGLTDLIARFADRTLDVDREIAETWGKMAAARMTAGRPLPTADGLIAATAQVHSLTLVTRNTQDFAGLDVALFDPWKAKTPGR